MSGRSSVVVVFGAVLAVWRRSDVAAVLSGSTIALTSSDRTIDGPTSMAPVGTEFSGSSFLSKPWSEAQSSAADLSLPSQASRASGLRPQATTASTVNRVPSQASRPFTHSPSPLELPLAVGAVGCLHSLGSLGRRPIKHPQAATVRRAGGSREEQ